MNAFLTAKKIWINDSAKPDEYAEFKHTYVQNCDEKPILRIASDSNFVVYLNGKPLNVGQYPDYPDYRVYSSVTLDGKRGENELRIVAWHYGIDTQTHIKSDAYLVFEVTDGDKILAKSDETVLSRLCGEYENHRKKLLSVQLGLGYKYVGKNGGAWQNSVVLGDAGKFNPSPVKKLEVGDRVPVVVTKTHDGYLVDMRVETVGFLDFDVESDRVDTVTVAYGEYLLPDGNVNRTLNGSDDFSAEVEVKKGGTVFTNRFRRLAGRYLQITCKADLRINYVGLLPVYYPISYRTRDFGSELRNRIYETALRTLRCCTHEHFEDCPLREQALYVMDARNEMLSTYAASGDTEFARSNLLLVSKGLRSDGLLSLCFPAGRDIPIPSFSLIYPLAVWEYYLLSGDKSLVCEVFPAIKSIFDVFTSRIDRENGLIADFDYPYWNYYEWTEGSDNAYQIGREKPDGKREFSLILNLWYAYSSEAYVKICDLLGEEGFTERDKVANALKSAFYDKDKRLYKAKLGGKPFYTAYGNSLAILAGFGDEETAKRILTDPDVIRVTLAMSVFEYDALLKVNAEKYRDYVLADIDSRYGRMLNLGATTFWETENSLSATEHTGSLCHGWSALPIYYYDKLLGRGGEPARAKRNDEND